MSTITCVEDFRKIYKRRVPRMFYDFVEAGSYTESTLHNNEADLQKILIRQRVGVDVSDIDSSASVLREAARLPVAFAPIGMLGMQRAGGEIKVARAAKAFGVPFILSTMSTCSLEQVYESTQTPYWLQLHVVKDRDFVRNLIQRAKAANCTALVIAMDLAMWGQRHKDIKNRMSIRPGARNILNMMTRPKWAFDMVTTPYKGFGNVMGHAKGVNDLNSLLAWSKEVADPSLNWNDIEWIRKEWDGKIILKGITDVEDARTAAAAGIDAIIVSNHGGRQLDGAGSSIYWLPRIADAVGDKIELLFDSGIRTGMDIFRARALGASGVLLGRAMVYALGAAGQQGVEQLLVILENELRTTMALAGKTRFSDITSTDVVM